MYNKDVYDNPTYLINPTINSKQYCPKGVDFSTEQKTFKCN